MNKIFKKVLKIAFLTLFAGILTITDIILFPQQLFAKKLSYNKFIVYSNDNVDGHIKTVLDNASILVLKSELFDSAYTYNIIFCKNSFYNIIDDKLLGVGRTARASLHNVIIKVSIDSKRNLAFPIFQKPCEENLTEVIAHEMMHCLQARKYGILKFNPFRHPEFWKLEGYPEYISKQKELSGKDINLIGDIDRYVKLKSETKDIWIISEEGSCEEPDYYYRGMLMIEYLINMKYLTYDQILKDSRPEEEIYNEMIEWAARQ